MIIIFLLQRLGDLGELASHGSLHQYLVHLHKKGAVPVTSFRWGKTHVISVCNAQAFKELVGLVNRPGAEYSSKQAHLRILRPFSPLRAPV